MYFIIFLFYLPQRERREDLPDDESDVNLLAKT